MTMWPYCNLHSKEHRISGALRMRSTKLTRYQLNIYAVVESTETGPGAEGNGSQDRDAELHSTKGDSEGTPGEKTSPRNTQGLEGNFSRGETTWL